MPEKLAFTQLKRSLEVILLLKLARKKIARLRNVTDEFVTKLRQVTDFRRIRRPTRGSHKQKINTIRPRRHHAFERSPQGD